jgi:glycosyltransferase involved in cell wall biosynthesis
VKVAHLDTGREWRGGQAQVLLLMRGLEARGHRNLLLAPPGPLLERAEEAGLETRRWRSRGDWDLGAAWRAARLLREAGPDLVHCHTGRAHALGAMAARLVGAPAVVSRRVPVPVRRHPASLLKYRFGVVRYLCVSRRAMAELERVGVRARRLALVPSGIEIEPAASAEAPPAGADLRSLIGAGPGAAVVGTVAALTREKNPTLLAEAARAVRSRLPDARFVWIGEGPCRAELEDERRGALPDPVHLLGFRPDARALLAQMTLFVLPSSWEGLGTSVLDAQAAGVPVIATAVGGVGDLIEDGVNGRLVPAGDALALSGAVVEALEDPGMRARWAAAARSTVRAFSAGAMVERTLEEYRTVLSELAPEGPRRDRGS